MSEEKTSAAFCGLRVFCSLDIHVYLDEGKNRHRYIISEATYSHNIDISYDRTEDSSSQVDLMFKNLSKTIHFVASEHLDISGTPPYPTAL